MFGENDRSCVLDSSSSSLNMLFPIHDFPQILEFFQAANTKTQLTNDHISPIQGCPALQTTKQK